MTQQRVLKVLERIGEAVKEDEDTAEMYSDVLEESLSELCNNDAFGSEGQCDPRGDQREGPWRMTNVEGIYE